MMRKSDFAKSATQSSDRRLFHKYITEESLAGTAGVDITA